MSSQTEMRWKKFNPAPLTILFPSEKALCNPPFIHWGEYPGAAEYRVSLVSPAGEKEWTTEFNFFTPPENPTPGPCSVQVLAIDDSGKEIAESEQIYCVLPEPDILNPQNLNRLSSLSENNPFPSQEEIFRNKGSMKSGFAERISREAQKVADAFSEQLKEPPRYKNGVWDFDVWKFNNNLCVKIEENLLLQAIAWKVTGESAYLQEAKKILLKIAGWDPEGGTGVWENDHSAYAMLNAISSAYWILASELNGQEAGKVISSLQGRCRDMFLFLNPFVVKETSSGPMNDPDNNHPWFCTAALGLGGLALLEHDPEAEKWVCFSAQMFQGVYLPRGGKKGGWHEGIDYMTYMLFFSLQFCHFLKTSTSIDLFRAPWLKHASLFKIYAHPPQGAYVPFGDCKHHRPGMLDKLVVMKLASEYNDPAGREYVKAIPEEIEGIYLFYALLWSHEKPVKEKEQISFPEAIHFEDVGWVVSNSNVFQEEEQVLFAMRCGKSYGRGFNHSHADLNHFIVTAAGEKLIWDGGYYDSYLSPHHRDYSRHSVAHNTILVDGFGQVVHRPGLDGKIVKYWSKNDSLEVWGDASNPLIYGGKIIRFIRKFHYENRSEFRIEDDILAFSPSKLSFLLHSEYPVMFDPETNGIEIRGKTRSVQGRIITEESVRGIISKGFPVLPDKPSNVLREKTSYPIQYHLELKTENSVEIWTPVFEFRIIKM